MEMVFPPAGPINAAMLLRFGKRINLIPVYEATIVHQISDGGAAGGLLEQRQMCKGGTDGNNEQTGWSVAIDGQDRRPDLYI